MHNSHNNLTITYNSINQPQQVKSGSTVKQKFAYLADGRKLLSLDKIKSNDNIDKDGGLAYIGSSVFIINEGKYDGFESTSFSAGRIVRNSSGTYAVRYHITDHLGSVRAVLNQSMTVLEQNDYYPFGLRHPNASLKTTANRYRYNGKEEIAADATSDYGARQYSAEFCQWLQVDLLAEKRYGISAYNFCSGNPINRIDPDGRDDYEINSKGEIVNRIKNKEADNIFILNKDGKRMEGQSISFKKGTITAVRSPKINVKGKEGNIITKQSTIFEIRGDDNATEFFEFLANPSNTGVEWTHAKIGTKEFEQNIIGSTHEKSSTAVGHYLNANNYTLKSVTHNHPSGNYLPSEADMKGAESYKKRNPNLNTVYFEIQMKVV